MDINKVQDSLEREYYESPTSYFKVTMIKTMKDYNENCENGSIGTIHSAIVYKEEEEKKEEEEEKKEEKKEEEKYKFDYTHIFFFDNNDMYVQKFGRRKIFAKNNQQIYNLISFTTEVCYAICKGSD